jgi:hypothetical protein
MQSQIEPVKLPKLKLGIMLDSPTIPAWVEVAIRRIVDRNSGDIVLVILNGQAGNNTSKSSSTWMYSFFNLVDSKLFGREPDPFAPKDITSILSNAQVLTIYPEQLTNGFALEESDAREIRRHSLDILIRIGFESLKIEHLCLAKYGVWYYYHGDDRTMSGGPPGFWEVVENRPETGTALLAVEGEKFVKRVLYRSLFFTYPLSPARHRSYYFWSAATFLPRQIEYLHRFGEEAFWQQTEQYNLASSDTRIKNYHTPPGLQAIIPIARIALRLFKELWRRTFYLDQWFLLLSRDNGVSGSLSTFEKLIPPKGLFWADPHLVRSNEEYYIFIEEFSRKNGKGHISVIELDQSGKWKLPVTALEKGYHLSYPFVFKWHDKYYMIPESSENKTVDIYECIAFPDRWEFRKNLIANVKAVDSTLIHYANKWWLFTAIAENEMAAPHVELFLFYSEDLFSGQWKAHAQNPIVSDVKKARPAGSLFVRDGRLIRPSQDCSKIYGYSINLNEIQVLSETKYCERRISSIRPDWDKRILATHTYSQQGKLKVMDAFRRVRKL